MPNKLLNFVPATNSVASTGLPTLRCGKFNVLKRLPTEVAPEITARDYEMRMLGLDCAQLLYKAEVLKIEQLSPVYSHRCSIWRRSASGQ